MVDAIVAIGSLILPPAMDFLKKKFIGTKTTPDAVLSELASTKPEIMAEYVKALTEKWKAEVSYFNRDVIGEPSRWVSNWRAVIRPLVVTVALLIMLIEVVYALNIPSPTRYILEVAVGSWMGSRLTKE